MSEGGGLVDLVEERAPEYHCVACGVGSPEWAWVASHCEQAHPEQQGGFVDYLSTDEGVSMHLEEPGDD